MKKLKVLLLAVVLALPIVVSAVSTAAASCSEAKLILYKDAGGGGPYLTVCYPSNVGDLAGTGWNDVASSVTFRDYTVDTAVCLWTNAYRSGSGLRFLNDQSTPYNLSSPWQDSVSSIEWGNDCLLAGVSDVP